MLARVLGTTEKNMPKKLGPKIARNAIFLVINPSTVILNEFWMKINWNLTSSCHYFTESITSLQSCKVSYSRCQNAAVINNSEWKFSFNFFLFLRWVISVLSISTNFKLMFQNLSPVFSNENEQKPYQK